jgi:hypothetical protein
VLLWLSIPITPPLQSLNTTFGPIPHPNYIPVLYFSLRTELIDVSIFVNSNELSFEEQLRINVPSGFIYRSIVAISIIELEFTTKLRTASPVFTLNTFMLPKITNNVPFLVAAKTCYGLRMQGCSWQIKESLGILI